MAHQHITYPEKVSDLKLLGPEMSLRLLVTKNALNAHHLICTEQQLANLRIKRVSVGRLLACLNGWVGEIKYGLIAGAIGAFTS